MMYRQFNDAKRPNANPKIINQTNALRINYALEFYINWHLFIDSLHVPRFRLEDFNENIVWDIYYKSGFHKLPRHSSKLNETKIAITHFFKDQTLQKPKNQRKHRSTLTWNELCLVNTKLTNKFWNLSQKYGYYHDLGNNNNNNNKPPCD